MRREMFASRRRVCASERRKRESLDRLLLLVLLILGVVGLVEMAGAVGSEGAPGGGSWHVAEGRVSRLRAAALCRARRSCDAGVRGSGTMESNPGTPVVLPELDPANDATDFVKDARLANATPEERIVLLSCAPDKLVGVFKRFVRRHGPYNYTEYRLGPDATSRLLCVVPTHGGSLHYDGEWGTEYRVACWDATGHAKWYEGAAGGWRLCRARRRSMASRCATRARWGAST